jgi:hypothetical protein
MQLWSCAKLGADIIRTPTRAEVERRLGVSLWGPYGITGKTNNTIKDAKTFKNDVEKL